MPDFERPARPRPAASAGINWLLAILLILMTGYIWRTQGDRRGLSEVHDSTATNKPIVARGDLAADELATIDLFKKASPSVVHITNLAVRRDLLDDNGDALAFREGSGSGFVWDENGYIVTNAHVIETGSAAAVKVPDGSNWARAAKVTLADRSEWDARLVGQSKDKDIAVLKIEAPPERLQPLLIGNSTNLLVGQKVFAIGNPFGLDQTLTTGVISGLGREILSVTQRPIQGVIQTDAAVNPGNSGGPLLDSAGLVIGVNTAIYSPSGGSAGIGFAVPIDPIRWIVPQLIRHGKVERIGLGVDIWNDYITKVRFGLDGALIMRVREGSPAASAGLRSSQIDRAQRVKPGDLIIAVEGRPVHDSLDLFRILDQYRANDTVKVTVYREGGEVIVPVTLDVVDER
jgi:S1-C subfamily serine protease